MFLSFLPKRCVRQDFSFMKVDPFRQRYFVIFIGFKMELLGQTCVFMDSIVNLVESTMFLFLSFVDAHFETIQSLRLNQLMSLLYFGSFHLALVEFPAFSITDCRCKILGNLEFTIIQKNWGCVT